MKMRRKQKGVRGSERDRIFNIRLMTAFLAALFFSLIGWLSFVRRTAAVEAADIAGGISATIAVIGAFALLYPRLKYVLLPRKLRRLHRAHIKWLTLTVSEAFVALSGSTGTAQVRTEALVALHTVSKSHPGMPASVIDDMLDLPEQTEKEIAAYKQATEQVTVSGALEGPRLEYQIKLFLALGKLQSGVGYELGGHGYVTDLWKRSLMDWVLCASTLNRVLERPFDPPPSEEQLSNLHDRLNSPEFNEHATKPLTEGSLVRIRQSETEWIDTLRLTADPEIVARRDSGMPIWKLEVVDALGVEETFVRDRTSFEPAPVA